MYLPIYSRVMSRQPFSVVIIVVVFFVTVAPTEVIRKALQASKLELFFFHKVWKTHLLCIYI